LVLTYFGFSAATVAYQAWGADIGADSTVRTRLVAAREGFGLLGIVLAAALPTLLASGMNEGVARLSWLLPPLLLLAGAVSLYGAAENRPAAPALHAPLLGSLRRVFADQAFRRLLMVFVANGIAAALPATLFLFFVADVLQAEAASGPLLALYFIAGAASLPLWVRLAARYGRVVAWLLAIALAIVAFASASRLGSGDLWSFAAICLASGLALGADLALPAAIVADLGERHGQAGTCFGVWNLVAKLNLALAAGLSLPLIGALGYVPGSGSGLSALIFAYALLPLAFKLLAGGLLWRWRLSLELKS
jgi:Na+/melibiose symporter-like transporter